MNSSATNLVAAVMVGLLTAPTATALPKCPDKWVSTWANCQGEISFPDGGKYVGDFQHGKMNGQGTYTWPNGTKYVGTFRDDKMDGHGIKTFPNLQKYIGEFREGNRSGYGVQTSPEGQKYEGAYRDDKPNGEGTFTWADGAKYVGEWRDGKCNGQGIFTWPDGAKYVGEWKDDQRSGQGVYTQPDGVKQVGTWANDKFVSATADFGNSTFHGLANKVKDLPVSIPTNVSDYFSVFGALSVFFLIAAGCVAGGVFIFRQAKPVTTPVALTGHGLTQAPASKDGEVRTQPDAKLASDLELALTRLATLRDKGILTNAEYEQERNRISQG